MNCAIRYTLTKTTRRLTFDVLFQRDDLIFKGDDDGPYFTFTASNGYQVISRSRMDIQTERLWLLGAKHEQEARSGSMVFSTDEKRDAAYDKFIQAIDEWAKHHNGFAHQLGCAVAEVVEQLPDNEARIRWLWNPVPEGQQLLWIES